MRDFSQVQQLVITSLTSLKVFLLHEERNKFRPYADLLMFLRYRFVERNGINSAPTPDLLMFLHYRFVKRKGINSAPTPIC